MLVLVRVTTAPVGYAHHELTSRLLTHTNWPRGRPIGLRRGGRGGRRRRSHAARGQALGAKPRAGEVSVRAGPAVGLSPAVVSSPPTCVQQHLHLIQ